MRNKIAISKLAKFKVMEPLLPIPDNFQIDRGSGLYLPPGLHTWSGVFGNFNQETHTVELPPEPEFEVNMMEALVGWKSWDFSVGFLYTRGKNWPKDEPLKAVCDGGKGCEVSPTDSCTCGIYASTKEGAEEYRDEDSVFGMVYGWGRYVRGGEGWRAQFAYPKCLFLKSGQANLIDALRLYHVPIYIEQPQLIYNPEEDGYEHREEGTDWDSGAAEESASGEEGDYCSGEGSSTSQEELEE